MILPAKPFDKVLKKELREETGKMMKKGFLEKVFKVKPNGLLKSCIFYFTHE